MLLKIKNFLNLGDSSAKTVGCESKANSGLCDTCYAEGYCQNLTTRVTTDEELRDGAFVFDVKTFIVSLGLGPKSLRQNLVDVMRDMKGGFYDLGSENVEVLFDLERLETEAGEEWLKELCNWKPGPTMRAHVCHDRWEDFRAISSILRASDPIKALGWGGRSSMPALL